MISSDKDVAKLSARECADELGREADIDILRSLVGLLRLLHSMQQGSITGKIHTDVRRGQPVETYIVGERIKNKAA